MSADGFRVIAHGEGIGDVRVEDDLLVRAPREPGLGFALRVFERMKSAGREANTRVLNDLRERAGDVDGAQGERNRCMTWEQVRAMGCHGMEIGSHSLSHRSLARIPIDDAMHEIRESKRLIEQETGHACIHFAFPFGSAKDYNDALVDYVRWMGFETCSLNVHGYNHMDGDPFRLKRVIMSERTNTETLLG
jgi:peptidoglycan/xylan/chitin deacetylase (PgdA/CDA1 family)